MEALSIFVEEFNNFITTYGQIFEEETIPLVRVNNISTSNILDELLENYTLDSIIKYTEFIILPKAEQIKVGDLFAFAENIHANFYFVLDTRSKEISCIDFDGDFLWHASKNLEILFHIMTIYLRLRIERIRSEEGDIRNESKVNFLIQMKEISGDDKYLAFYKYLCAVI